MESEQNEHVFDVCHSLHQALAPGQNVLESHNDTSPDTVAVGANSTPQMDNDALEDALAVMDDDANRVIRDNDINSKEG
jgi:hypothetical protein